MLVLLDSLKDSIERFVLNIVPLKSTANCGDTTLEIPSVFYFPIGTEFVISHETDPGCPNAEKHCVTCFPDKFSSTTIGIDSPLGIAFPEGSTLQPLINGETVQYVTTGNPPDFPRYPAITIDEQRTDNSPLTLGTLSQEKTVIVSVWCDGVNHDRAYKTRDILTERIATTLFKTAFPLVKPWWETTLVEPYFGDSDTIKVADPAVLRCLPPIIYFLTEWERYPSRIIEDLNNGVFRIELNLNHDFPVGTKIIRQLIQLYDCFLVSSEYGSDNTGLLMASQLTYKVKIMRSRYGEPFTL